MPRFVFGYNGVGWHAIQPEGEAQLGGLAKRRTEKSDCPVFSYDEKASAWTIARLNYDCRYSTLIHPDEIVWITKAHDLRHSFVDAGISATKSDASH